MAPQGHWCGLHISKPSRSLGEKKLINSKGFTPTRALNKTGVGKIRDFQPISRRIPEMVQAKTISD